MSKHLTLKEHYQYMKKCGRDQKFIAKEMGWQQSDVSKFMSDPLNYRLSADTFVKLQRVFGCQTLDKFYELILLEAAAKALRNS